ncbi:MAG: hypothetical protein AUJ92_07205 [Armatimonadetes bacterium CG2_30_59_28]|nr:hypothetical protein [Armatimonadota bacterium]OIO95925.1 MAG: hypothetical protein AUJ92_07205 [Armatimonadetes bacterium CG2_30_59_28]PIU67270.1 MAG: hypothetical protein COS85_01375 [Armatimonadetes bacterium CG07_land_8_20_14_0_80_59_28]PIY43117.1 MAG: hypothetical protein COZ05_12030 [Armatimonadetes bacterium CG_4_10_14_3_um_filter_59_10]PJB73750.1 MAG: hypothetical protein CO095_05485 [Armatimonadetes bacterium CG_4_9_14_3_um_filter_58_7]
MPRLVILSGPSGIGKSPLHKALERLYPEQAEHLKPLVLYNSRDPRPGEKDGVAYHFRSRAEIEGLRGSDGFLVCEVRSDLQALELQSVKDVLNEGNDAFFEGNPYVIAAMQDSGFLADIDTVSAFISPLLKEEILDLRLPERRVDLRSFVTDVMRRKLLRRTQKQKGILSLKDLENIETRCGCAFQELQYAHRFDWVIPNHDGEDSENWDAFYYPVGDARQALLAFVAVLEGQTSERGEKWEEDLLR